MGAVLDFYNEYHNSDWVGHSIPDDITNRYEIKACLKMNEEKQVYLVTSKTNWNKYVLKALSRNCHESLEEEYKLSRELSHPGIAASIEYIEGTDYNYLIREYVEGYTATELVEMTEKGHLEAEELRRIALQLCDILQYLHSQKPPIIHRDIKPDNVIITKHEECKLIDFGISRRYQVTLDSDTFVMGTQYSAPPEQYGFAQTNERSDIYSIGVLMFFMATGSMDIRDLKQYHISGDIRRIIKKCTKFSPKERYGSVKQLKSKLISYPLLYKKRGVLYTGAIAVAAAVLILGSSFFFMNRPVPKEINEEILSDITSYGYGSDASDHTKEQPASESPATEVSQSNPVQVAESGTKVSAEQIPAELTASDIESSEIEEKKVSEGAAQITNSPLIETSDTSERTAQSSDLGAGEEDRDKSAASVSQEEQNTLKETANSQKSDPVTKDEQIYKFQSPLIEAAVREQLGKSSKDSVTYGDLQQITSLLVCGQQRYERWDEHFVYGVNQYMTDPKYTGTQLYQVNGEITSLEDISQMVNLDKLALYHQKINDLSPLEDLHYLSYLGLGSNNISDLTSITKIKSLNYLDLSANPIMNDDLEVLKELPYLWGLDLGATRVSSVFGIKELRLSYLSLFECKMGDCIGLDEMTSLDNLIITGVNNAVTNQAIDRVSKLTNLKILKIFGSDSIDLSKFSSLKSLYLIDLCGMWGSSNLKDLGDIPISQLYISFMKKLDLTGIEKLSYVEQINLQDSVCADYTPLIGVKKLKRVYCNQEQMKIIKEQLGEFPFEIIVQ